MEPQILPQKDRKKTAPQITAGRDVNITNRVEIILPLGAVLVLILAMGIMIAMIYAFIQLLLLLQAAVIWITDNWVYILMTFALLLAMGLSTWGAIRWMLKITPDHDLV